MTTHRWVTIASLSLCIMAADAVAGEVPVGTPEYAKLLENPDGTLYSAKLDSGSSGMRIDVVILGDGYASDEQDEFDVVVDEMVSDFLGVEPYKSMQCGMNIWVVHVISPVSGAGDGSSPLQSEIAGGGSRKIDGNLSRCREICDAADVPGADAIVVIANNTAYYAAWSPDYGGITFMTSSIPYGRLLAHELGHVIAGLGDEYTCSACTDSEEPRAYTGTGALEPNLTVLEYTTDTSGATVVDRSKIPWHDMIGSWTEIPTTVGNSCYWYEIGAWEGGGTYATGIWRPQERCLMLYLCGSYGEFCMVCYGVIKDALSPGCTYDVLPGTDTDPPVSPPRPELLANIDDLRVVERMVSPFPTIFDRWLPPCWSCPPEIPTEHAVTVELTGLASPDAAFIVVDDRDRFLARAERIGASLVAKFDFGLAGSARLRIYTGTSPANSFVLGARVRRAMHEQQLPSGDRN
jgi:hypothetical protein